MSRKFSSTQGQANFSPGARSPGYSEGLRDILRRVSSRIRLCPNARAQSDCLWLSSVACSRDKYPTHDLELAAVIYALKLWRHYLVGNRCEVYSDHQSLKYIFTQPDLNLRQQRWLETIADFNMDISYTLGNANVMADALSRKSYCNAVEVQLQQPLLYEEFQKLNLEI